MIPACSPNQPGCHSMEYATSPLLAGIHHHQLHCRPNYEEFLKRNIEGETPSRVELPVNRWFSHQRHQSDRDSTDLAGDDPEALCLIKLDGGVAGKCWEDCAAQAGIRTRALLLGSCGVISRAGRVSVRVEAEAQSSNIRRAIIILWISVVPSYISVTFASR